MKKRKSVILLAALAMLFARAGAFTQEVKQSPWRIGLEGSYGVISGKGLLDNYSVSLQGMYEIGRSASFISLDLIGHGTETLGTEIGLLGSLFLCFPIGDIFLPYAGGGLGVKSSDGNPGFAWKVDAGAAARLSNLWYIKAGAMYDNIREDLGITVGCGVRLTKIVTGTYRSGGNSVFKQSFTRFIWQNNSTPNSIYADEFASSEVVNKYRTTRTTAYTTGDAAFATHDGGGGGGETVTSSWTDNNGNSGTITTRKSSFRTTTTYYVYDVTVTRNWYTRTWYYKDRSPTTQKVYKDVESTVLVDRYSRTE